MEITLQAKNALITTDFDSDHLSIDGLSQKDIFQLEDELKDEIKEQLLMKAEYLLKTRDIAVTFISGILYKKETDLFLINNIIDLAVESTLSESELQRLLDSIPIDIDYSYYLNDGSLLLNFELQFNS